MSGKSLLARAWHRQLPGTQSEFAHFLGIERRAISRLTWASLSELMEERFKIYPLGGGVKLAGTKLELKTFRFQPPHQNIWWRKGVPAGGAQIDSASDGALLIGTGKTIDEAALSAVLGLWELTWRRAHV